MSFTGESSKLNNPGKELISFTTTIRGQSQPGKMPAGHFTLIALLTTANGIPTVAPASTISLKPLVPRLLPNKQQKVTL